jgi:hypothetical protein
VRCRSGCDARGGAQQRARVGLPVQACAAQHHLSQRETSLSSVHFCTASLAPHPRRTTVSRRASPVRLGDALSPHLAADGMTAQALLAAWQAKAEAALGEPAAAVRRAQALPAFGGLSWRYVFSHSVRGSLYRLLHRHAVLAFTAQSRGGACLVGGGQGCAGWRRRGYPGSPSCRSQALCEPLATHTGGRLPAAAFIRAQPGGFQGAC